MATGYGQRQNIYGSKITTYKVSDDMLKEEVSNIKPAAFGRTADSFLASLQAKKAQSVDISQYKEGTRVYHKKFGEGVITKVEQEDDDAKVDIEFDKAGHKRLMAKFAGLEILD